MSRHQTLVTAVVANAERVDGVAPEVQFPNYQAEELGYLNMTAQQDYPDLEVARQRFIDLLHYQKKRLSYRKRTEIAAEIVRQLETEGQFPHAPYAFDNGGFSLLLTQLIEQREKLWVSDSQGSRFIQWQGQWYRVDALAAELRQQHSESFRRLNVKLRGGEGKLFRVFTKTVRLKRYGRKRLVLAHEQAELQDPPRFLLTDAPHWEGERIIRVWSYRFCKQAMGLEAAQVRKEEAVKRHFRLSCVAQSLLQHTPAGDRKSERFAFAENQPHTLARQALGQTLHFVCRVSLHRGNLKSKSWSD